MVVVNGVVVDSVAWACRSRLRLADLFLLSSGVVVVNGVPISAWRSGSRPGGGGAVGLGLEVVEPCRIWLIHGGGRGGFWLLWVDLRWWWWWWWRRRWVGRIWLWLLVISGNCSGK
uniref:Uncharacterized protein n=1 Tax=Fagus sylvatica TaxID=28930 RepID=A0A2N9IXG3_FAGSY